MPFGNRLRCDYSRSPTARNGRVPPSHVPLRLGQRDETSEGWLEVGSNPRTNRGFILRVTIHNDAVHDLRASVIQTLESMRESNRDRTEPRLIGERNVWDTVYDGELARGAPRVPSVSCGGMEKW